MPAEPGSDSGIHILTKLRGAAEWFIVHSPFRWFALFFLIAALVGTAVYSYLKINDELTAAALSRREAVAQLMGITLAEKFGRSVDIAVSLSTRIRFRDMVSTGQWSEAIKILHDAPVHFPYIERIFLTDVSGKLRAVDPASHDAIDTDVSSEEWFQGVSLHWRPYISAVYQRKEIPQMNIFAVAVPVKSSSGQITGILVLQIRLENLLKWVDDVILGLNSFMYILDSRDQMAFHSRFPARKEIIDLSASNITRKLRHDTSGVEIGPDDMEQKQSIFAYAVVPDYHWAVVTQQPVSSSNALNARDLLLQQLTIGFILILFFGTATSILLLRFAISRQQNASNQRMQAELEQRVQDRTSELQLVNQELEAFSYSVSHDLRAPLRTIDGFGQALLEDYNDQLDDIAKDYINRIRNATQRIGLLIDDMLTLSRVTRSMMQYGIVDLSKMAIEVLDDLQKTEPDRKVELNIESDLIAEGDKHLIRIALENLLGNAWKYTARQPQPHIEFGAIRNANGQTEFFVRDNGAGFDMNYADKLFGAFQRLHMASEFPGTGIGLATVQRVIHRHGGQVRGVGKTDLGASFFFTLPYRVQQGDPNEP